MKSFISLLSILTITLGVNAAQATTVDKIFDGTGAYCPQPDPQRWEKTDRFIQIKVEGEDLVITPVRCDETKFVVDGTLVEHRYTTVEGVHVVERHSRYQLLAYTDDYSVVKKIDLPRFAVEKGGRVKLSEIAAVAQVVDISVNARVDYEASNGFKDFNNLSYGAFRIRFK